MNSSEEQKPEMLILELLNIFSSKPMPSRITSNRYKLIQLEKLKSFGRTYGFINDYGRNLAWTYILENLYPNKKVAHFDQVKSRKFYRAELIFRNKCPFRRKP